MGVGQLSESDAVDALRLPFYSSSHPTGSHGWRNQFDLGNPDLYTFGAICTASPAIFLSWPVGLRLNRFDAASCKKMRREKAASRTCWSVRPRLGEGWSLRFNAMHLLSGVSTAICHPIDFARVRS